MTGATWKLRWHCLLTAFRPGLTADRLAAPVRRKKDRRNHLLTADKAYGRAPSSSSLPATTAARPGEVVVLCGPGPEVIIVQSKPHQPPTSSPSSSHPLWASSIAVADDGAAGVAYEAEAEVADVRAEPVEARPVVPEADLQMYAAIIGRIPVVDLTRPAPPALGETGPQPMQLALPSFVPAVAPHADRVLRNVLTNHQRVKLTSWLRQVSSDARRRIGQARTRLASRAA